MKKLVIYYGLVILSFLITTNAFSQNIAISDVSHTADASAVLDVYSGSLGMLVPRMATAPSSPATGLLYYNTASNAFNFYDGSNWKALDYDDPWQHSGGTTTLTNINDFVGIGTSVPSYPLEIDATTSTPIFMVNSALNGDVGISFNNTNGGSLSAFSTGIISGLDEYVIRNTSAIAPGIQGDGNTVMTGHGSGIVDFSNQSRARVYQSIPNSFGIGGQLIPFGVWTEIMYDQLNYDEQNEIVLGNHMSSTPSYFTAKEEGYYQVNARIDFILHDVEFNESMDNPYYKGYVSIAIYVSTDGGATYNMYAQGNKLQGTDNNAGWTNMPNNLAPNVSDVVPLKAGDMIKIFAWQNLGINAQGAQTFLPLRLNEQNGQGGPSTQIYCSIHKSS